MKKTIQEVYEKLYKQRQEEMQKQILTERLIQEDRERARLNYLEKNRIYESITSKIKEKYLIIKFKDTTLFKTSEVGSDTIYNLVEKDDSFLNTILLSSPYLNIFINYIDGFIPMVLINNMEKLYNKLVSYSIDSNIFEFTFDENTDKITIYSKVYYKDPLGFQALYKDFMVNRFDIEIISGNQLDFRLVYAYLLQSIFINETNINNNTIIEISDFFDYFNTILFMFSQKLFSNMQKVGSGDTYYLSSDGEIGETKILSGSEEFLRMLGFIFTTHFKNYIKKTVIDPELNEIKIIFRNNVQSVYYVENSVFSDSTLYDYIFQNVVDIKISL